MNVIPADVPEELKSHIRKDYVTVIDDNGNTECIPIGKVLEKYGIFPSLEEVYGKGYVDMLTPEEIATFEPQMCLYKNGDGYIAPKRDKFAFLDKPPVEKPRYNLMGTYGFLMERDLYATLDFPTRSFTGKLPKNPDEAEALNEDGILAANEQKDFDKAVACFRQAIALGNENAKQNLFSLLWSIERFEEAWEYLQEVNSLPNPNPNLCWNEAIICSGYIEDSPFEPNSDYCYELMKCVIKNFKDHPSHIDLKAINFLEREGFDRKKLEEI